MSDTSDMAHALDNMPVEVTDWEADFLENIMRLINDDMSLSEKQVDCLKDMYTKYKCRGDV